MSDAPPPIPNPAVHPGALCAPDFDYSKLELRVLATMVDGGLPVLPWQQEIIDRLGRKEARIAIDPASPGSDKTVVIVGDGVELFILDEFDMHMENGSRERRRWVPSGARISGTLTATFENEEALRALLYGKPEQAAEIKPDNRKQRRIDEAKARQKRPRGQRKRMIFDIETDAYGRNRTKDWK
jgi:hypothetical protein